MEAWLHTFAFPRRVAPLAQRAEGWGFEGLRVADSQNLKADVWVELALAAAATERIALGPGVTNPVTRHLAVSASAAATLHVETGGRAVLGLGRGDTALAQIGRKPVPTSELERALVVVQGLLRGEEVELEDGARSRIHWIGEGGAVEVPGAAQRRVVGKVPVTVAASGPQVIAAAARHAERIDLTVGAEPDRLRWAIALARDAAGDAPPSLGVFLNLAVDDDRASARDLVRGSTASFARFAAEGAPADGLSDVTRAGIERLAADYDPARHGRADAPHARGLEDAFIDRFALAGPAPEVVERLNQIAALGIERMVVVPGSLDADPAAIDASLERFVRDVLPHI